MWAAWAQDAGGRWRGVRDPGLRWGGRGVGCAFIAHRPPLLVRNECTPYGRGKSGFGVRRARKTVQRTIFSAERAEPWRRSRYQPPGAGF